jgi:hypothetical protein
MFKKLFDKTKVEFTSKYSIDESVIRLKDVVRSGWSLLPIRASLYGWITRKRIRLYWGESFGQNSIKPFFIGSFHHSHGKVVLSGNYTVHPLIKLSIVIWFGVILIMTVGILIIIIRDVGSGELSTSDIKAVGFMLFFSIISVLSVKLGQRFSRNDISNISKAIEETLSETPNPAPASPQAYQLRLKRRFIDLQSKLPQIICMPFFL